MASVRYSRVIDADADRLREAIADVEPFMTAAGFDAVEVEDSRLEIRNSVGLGTIELTCEILDDPDVALRIRQLEGMFESMDTVYRVEPVESGVEVIAETEFTLGGLPGTVLDPTIISRQRKREFTEQFDYLANLTGD